MGASLPPPTRLFTPAGLAGKWHVTRQIEDARNGGTAHLAGQAVFTRDAEGLAYDESGTLTLETGQSFAATRRYLWRFDGIIRVLFDNGALFHSLDPRTPEAPLLHLCGDDIYRGHYKVSRDHWETHWQVSGPRKDQRSLIIYRRP